MSIGINALIPALNIKIYKKDLDRLIEKVIGVCKDTIIWSPYALANDLYNKDLRVISSINRNLCKKYNLLFIDMYKEFLKYDLKRLFTYKMPRGNMVWGIKDNDIDFLHCNELGNQIIASKIARDVFKSDLSDWEYGSMILKDISKFKLRR